MKKNLLLVVLLVSSITVFATTTTVTPVTYEAAYNSAANGDILLLDAGTYSAALNFPVGKSITLKKLPAAASMPILTFSWATTTLPIAGSSLIMDSLEINLNGDYYFYPAASTIIDKLIFKNCIISNVKRSLIRCTNATITVNEISIENCIIKDCGAGGWAMVFFRQRLDKFSVINSTMYNYGGEGFFLANTNAQTHTFALNIQNNTIYNSGKDGAAYAWCVIGIGYGPTSTYNISNNIFNKPYNTSISRSAIILPAGSGTVTCKNNLMVDYPNMLVAPAAGWDTLNMLVSTINYFKDTLSRDFTLDKNIPYRGTDGNDLGDPRWWPSRGNVSVKNLNETVVKISANNGMIKLESNDIIGSVEIYNIRGNKLIAKKINATETFINTGNFNDGIYILKIKTQNTTICKKITLFK